MMSCSGINNDRHELLGAELGNVRKRAGDAHSDRPKLNWVINRSPDPAYVQKLLEIADDYGVHRIYLAAGSGGNASCLNKIIEDSANRIDICPADQLDMFDAAGRKLGGPALPYLAVDQVHSYLSDICRRALNDAFIQIDTPACTCYNAPSWVNVFAASCFMSDRSLSAERILDIYAETVFGAGGEAAKKVLVTAGKTLDRTVKVLASTWVLEDSFWPTSPCFYDRQFQADQSHLPELDHPDRKVLMKIDIERIDTLEDIYQALKALEQARDVLTAEMFLYLEDYLQRLKGICLVARRLVLAYFTLRQARQQSLTVQDPKAVLLGRLRDLRNVINEQKAVVSATPSDDRQGNYRRLAGFVNCYLAAIEELYPCSPA